MTPALSGTAALTRSPVIGVAGPETPFLDVAAPLTVYARELSLVRRPEEPRRSLTYTLLPQRVLAPNA